MKWKVEMTGVHVTKDGKKVLRPSTVKICDTPEEAEIILAKYAGYGYNVKIVKISFKSKPFDWFHNLPDKER